MEKIIKYELSKNEQFILFDEEFLNDHIKIDDIKDIDKFELLKKSLFLLEKLNEKKKLK